ncbi:hypothetical protein HHI36_013713 [Cryptolaemus montrouzieri]|uniref:beta-mannosidase n=1 Tax=Cryptolaemus montrouzieri TaxID=559131 RepID=A0ABD2NI13_9CUCU
MAHLLSNSSVYYQTCRGLNTKTSEFFKSSVNSNFDIVAVTESWLNPKINSCKVMCDKYTVFRRDGCETNSSRSEGGGILVGMAKEYHVEVLTNWINTSAVEDIWLRFRVSGPSYLYLEYTKLQAKVPGGIFSDLQQNKIIDDPILEDNDQTTHWVGRTNWTYYRNFSVGEELLKYSNINLVFEGIDTISTIFLNGREIGNSSDMFVRYIFDVKNELVVGNNSLVIKFLSPVHIADHIASYQNKTYPIPPACPPKESRGECHINQLRKMQASFSWDWGPALASVGIWKDVYLEAFNTNVIRYTVVEMEENTLSSTWNVSVVTYLSNNVLNRANGKLILNLDTDYDAKLTVVHDVNTSANEFDEIEISQSFDVPQSSVRRWWPNGYGEQCLYNVTATFISKDEQDQRTVRIGFRTVELVQDVINIGKKNVGNSFFFKVNGLPIFAKGSNAIPINILPEKSQDRKAIDTMLKTAKDCNINMLRVWGGGVYESDYYYRKADELGIMIWQDFMFACAMYPTRTNFLSNVKAEVRHQVRRLGSHPSIVLWAGNNENEAALTGNWYGTNKKKIYNEDYITLYFKTIKPEYQRILKKGTYIASSPTNGIKSEADGGISSDPYDPHYGDVHTYIYELDGFNPNIYPIPRFSSEYGFQSYPAFTTLEKCTKNASNLVIGSDFLKARQHHPLGDSQMELLISYQLDQIVQAVAIKTETEHYRKYRSIINDDGSGYTMGALYWQLNDVWAAPTWSGIDVTGKWKMLQYFIRDVFAPVIIFGHLKPDRALEITVVSDRTITIENVTLSISVYNWTSFAPMNVNKMNIAIERGTSKNVLSLDTDKYLSQIGCGSWVGARKNCLFHLSLSKNNNSIAPDNFVVPDKLKRVNSLRPTIQILSVDPLTRTDTRNFQVVISSSQIALFVWLESIEIPGKFSENGFHQINRTKTIYFESEVDTTGDIIKKSLVLSHI